MFLSVYLGFCVCRNIIGHLKTLQQLIKFLFSISTFCNVAYSFLSFFSEYKLTGFISHMGTSTMVGHYVAHLLKNDQWVIFNDNKVALSEHPPKDLGYMYVYERI